MRNAECTWKVGPRCKPPLRFRIPHSAFRTSGWGGGEVKRAQRRAQRETSAGGGVFRRGGGAGGRVPVTRHPCTDLGRPQGRSEAGRRPPGGARPAGAGGGGRAGQGGEKQGEGVA